MYIRISLDGGRILPGGDNVGAASARMIPMGTFSLNVVNFRYLRNRIRIVLLLFLSFLVLAAEHSMVFGVTVLLSMTSRSVSLHTA